MIVTIGSVSYHCRGKGELQTVVSVGSDVSYDSHFGVSQHVVLGGEFYDEIVHLCDGGAVCVASWRSGHGRFLRWSTGLL